DQAFRNLQSFAARCTYEEPQCPCGKENPRLIFIALHTFHDYDWMLPKNHSPGSAFHQLFRDRCRVCACGKDFSLERGDESCLGDLMLITLKENGCPACTHPDLLADTDGLEIVGASSGVCKP